MIGLLSLMLLVQDDFVTVGKGPGIACGTAFAVALRDGESLSKHDTGMDFIVYRFERPDGATVIYEGNAPQPGGVEKKTGINWPSVVAVHGSEEVASRVETGGAAIAQCRHGKAFQPAGAATRG